MTELIRKLNDLTGLSAEQQALFRLFDQLAIPVETFAHPPIFTVEEGLALDLHHHIPGQGGKSLLLTNKGGELWLVVACEETRTDIKALSTTLQSGRLSFAKPETMQQVIGVSPGSATPFALMLDTGRRVRVVIEDRFTAREYCVFHPLRNDLSTVIRFTDLQRFLTYLGYDPLIIPLTAGLGSA